MNPSDFPSPKSPKLLQNPDSEIFDFMRFVIIYTLYDNCNKSLKTRDFFFVKVEKENPDLPIVAPRPYCKYENRSRVYYCIQGGNLVLNGTIPFITVF